jgi:hypothetical protein
MVWSVATTNKLTNYGSFDVFVCTFFGQRTPDVELSEPDVADDVIDHLCVLITCPLIVHGVHSSVIIKQHASFLHQRF